MNKWKIEYYNQSVEKDTRRLHLSIKAKFEAIMDEMAEHGPDLGLPFTKPMGGGLFEIRAKGHAGIARGLFCAISNNTIVILHTFVKKTNKTPKNELDLGI